MENTAEQSLSPEFVKGYNEGYILAKQMPELAAKLEQAMPDSDRATGFKEGKAQYDYELERDRTPGWMNRYDKDGLRNKDDRRDRSASKEDREPEKD